MVQRSVPYVKRSPAWVFLVNNYEQAEVVQQIGPELTKVIPIAQLAVAQALNPPRPEEVFVALAPFVALVGQNWSQDSRDEFLNVAATTLSEYPAGLVLPAIEQAKVKLNRGEQLVPWVYAQIEADVTRLRYEREMLTRLSNLADQPKD